MAGPVSLMAVRELARVCMLATEFLFPKGVVCQMWGDVRTGGCGEFGHIRESCIILSGSMAHKRARFAGLPIYSGDLSMPESQEGGIKCLSIDSIINNAPCSKAVMIRRQLDACTALEKVYKVSIGPAWSSFQVVIPITADVG